MSDLAQRLQRSRWFAAKGREIAALELHPLPWWDANLRLRSEILTVRYADGGAERYQLLSRYTSEEADSWGIEPGLGHRHDASRDPESLRALLAAILSGATREDGSGAVDCRVLSPELLAVVDGLTPRPFGGEQSNTSVMYGDRAMLKLFRRLEPGANLDIEVHAALRGTPGVVGLDAAITAHWPQPPGQADSAPHDLGMLVGQVTDATDGWELALAAARSGTDFSAEAHALGRALRSVHTALAQAFATARVDAALITAQMLRRLHEATRIADELAPATEVLEPLLELSGQVTVQRVHGDFHLGQALYSGTGDWTIIDFEGEPMKSLAERREPDSVWRDVAGMLRSFDYAGATAADPGWADTAAAAFLAGYGADGTEPELRAYLADKAIYEVVYEVRNRPSWVTIPLRALHALTEMDDPSAHEPGTAGGEEAR